MPMIHDPHREEPSRETPPAALVDWSGLVDKIHAGDPAAMGELYQLFSRGVRFHLCRQLGPQELDDKVHDTFLIVVQAIRRGELREPERLMGFVRTVVKRQLAAYIDRAVQSRRDFQVLEHGSTVSDGRESPEESMISQQRAEIMESVLRSISKRDREILTRFYLLEQTKQQICADMNLSETQFRLLKSRAKTRFGEMGKRRLARRALHRVFLRKAGSSLH
jgi:RNA polymerase sigma-70 factor (ECF subfamily)